MLSISVLSLWPELPPQHWTKDSTRRGGGGGVGKDGVVGERGGKVGEGREKDRG